jgi:hypothetical protein
MTKKIIVIFLILGSLEVFSVTILGSATRMINLSAIALMVGILIVNLVYDAPSTIKKNYRTPIYLIFLAVFVSMFTAFFSYNQSFYVSLYAQRDIYFYLLYFTLHALKVEKKEFQRIIIYFGLLYFAIYLIQFFAFPTELLNVGMREERGTLRIYMEGAGYAMLSYFMCLQVFYTTNKFKYFLLSILFLSPIILFGTRSGLATIMIGTIFQLIFSKRIKAKALIIFLVLLAVIPTVFFFRDIFTGLLKATKSESVHGVENVRILAAQYFLTEFLNGISYITGMGAPSGQSPLGQMTMLLNKRYGYYLTDIGIIGNYVTYGALFAFSVLWIVYKTIFTKTKADMVFIKYFFFFEVFLMLPIAAGFAFAPPIAVLCCALYLTDLSHHEWRLEERQGAADP